jgi:hypothetical protein
MGIPVGGSRTRACSRPPSTCEIGTTLQPFSAARLRRLMRKPLASLRDNDANRYSGASRTILRPDSRQSRRCSFLYRPNRTSVVVPPPAIGRGALTAKALKKKPQDILEAGRRLLIMVTRPGDGDRHAPPLSLGKPTSPGATSGWRCHPARRFPSPDRALRLSPQQPGGPDLRAAGSRCQRPGVQRRRC